jgi:hypothetical protein
VGSCEHGDGPSGDGELLDQLIVLLGSQGLLNEVLVNHNNVLTLRSPNLVLVILIFGE